MCHMQIQQHLPSKIRSTGPKPTPLIRPCNHAYTDISKLRRGESIANKTANKR
jgi:hypothetical protein